MFDLKKPCTNCPFRKGVGENFRLPYQRLLEIRYGTAFQCHKTVDYDGPESEPGSRPQQCAGLMTLNHRAGEPNQIAQVAERLGHFDPETLDPDNEVYEDWAAALAAHNPKP